VKTGRRRSLRLRPTARGLADPLRLSQRARRRARRLARQSRHHGHRHGALRVRPGVGPTTLLPWARAPR